MDNYEDFISTVSHELRTPLTSIQGYTSRLLRQDIEIDEESDPEVKKVRKSLLNFLKISDYYEPQDVIQKLPESFLEEKLAALLKINTRESIQKCIELVVSRQVDFNVALHFCEEAYDKNDEDRCNVYNDLFFRVRQTYTNDNNMLIKCISELLNQKAEFLNPLNIVENIPKDILLSDEEYEIQKTTSKTRYKAKR